MTPQASLVWVLFSVAMQVQGVEYQVHYIARYLMLPGSTWSPTGAHVSITWHITFYYLADTRCKTARLVPAPPATSAEAEEQRT